MSTTAETLLASVDSLSTLQEVAAWDASAEKEIRLLGERLAQLSVLVDRAKSVWASVSLFKQPIAAISASISLSRAERQRRTEGSALEAIADALQAAIDKTPNNPQEQKDMLHELKLAKKELALQKKEINAHLTAVRTEARRQSAAVGTGLGLFLGTGTTRRLDRMNIRLQKEAALKPGENLKAQIERQNLLIERTIHWVEKFQ